MHTGNGLPASQHIVDLDNGVVLKITPGARLTPSPPTKASLARALLTHTATLLGQLEDLSEAEFVDVGKACVELAVKMGELPQRRNLGPLAPAAVSEG